MGTVSAHTFRYNRKSKSLTIKTLNPGKPDSFQFSVTMVKSDLTDCLGKRFKPSSELEITFLRTALVSGKKKKLEDHMKVTSRVVCRWYLANPPPR